jgi:hypothetical protein
MPTATAATTTNAKTKTKPVMWHAPRVFGCQSA